MVGVQRKNSAYPDHPQHADSDQRDDGRHHGVSESPQRPAHHIHHAAQEIGREENLHPQPPPCDHFRIRIVDGEQAPAVEQESEPHHQTDDARTSHAVKNASANPVIPAAAEVLADETDHGLVKSVRPDVDEPLQAGGRRVARHRQGAEGVDRGLDRNVRN